MFFLVLEYCYLFFIFMHFGLYLKVVFFLLGLYSSGSTAPITRLDTGAVSLKTSAPFEKQMFFFDLNQIINNRFSIWPPCCCM